MRQVNILEHALQLICELTATLCLQLRDHCLLSVIAGTPSQKQPFGQIFLVKGLKHILALHNAFMFSTR